ncbi:anti-sigma factor family protein [Thermodesulfobacteriota bacterium]
MNSDIICESELISRYLDNELNGEELERVETHIAGCDSCRIRLSDYDNISAGLNTPLYSQSDTVANEFENRVIESINRKENSGFRNWKNYLFHKRVLVPGLAASAALMFFTVFNDPAPAGPSAIISSLSGSGSSVMIMETPETRQTILWFNENG